MTQGPRQDARELKALVDLATGVAVEAGQLLLERWSDSGPSEAVTDSVRTKSSRTDLVTEADDASQRLILARLAKARPDDGIVAEEGGSHGGSSGLTWVIDPLDGTINFVYGFPIFGISIACQDGATSIAGVVHDPVRRETFTASADGGAWRNGERLDLAPGPELGEALVGTGFSYRTERRKDQARLLATVLPRVRDIRRAGAAAIDLCWVAAGRLDAFYEAGLAPWDVAAGSLIVTEAGGTVESVKGLITAEPTLPTLVAASPGLGRPLWDLLMSAA